MKVPSDVQATLLCSKSALFGFLQKGYHHASAWVSIVNPHSADCVKMCVLIEYNSLCFREAHGLPLVLHTVVALRVNDL